MYVGIKSCSYSKVAIYVHHTNNMLYKTKHKTALELFPSTIKKLTALLPKFLTMQKQQFVTGRNIQYMQMF